MSSDTNVWMGDIKPWMNESFILNSFKYYNIHPLSVKLIHDRTTNELKNYCFINFGSVEEANKCITMLNGKFLPNTPIKFRLNWANYFSSFNKSVYVGNLSPDVDDISLYNLFKEKYSSVHHASVMIENGKSKGFGFILFRGEKDYERCLNEMNGIRFHGNIIKVSEQKKKDDDTKSNHTNDNNDNYIYNYNNMYNNIYLNNNITINQNLLNDNYNNIDVIQNSINNVNLMNNINNYNLEQSLHLNQNKFNNNIINNIININNINKINTYNCINDIYNSNKLNNNLYFNNNMNDSDFINDNSNFNSINIPNQPSSMLQNPTENNNINSISSTNESTMKNFINNNQGTKGKITKSLKNDNLNEYDLEIMNKYDDETMKKKINENLEKMYEYYTTNYPGDINKLKCKLYILLFTFLNSFKFVYLSLPIRKSNKIIL